MNVLRFSDLCAQGKVAGQRVFIRADLNVPQDDAGNITEDTRIRASVPCIQMALKAGAAVMVTSHLGRPTEGEFKPEDSLAPVARRLGATARARGAAGARLGRRRRRSQPGQVVLLENCRVNKGEKKNNPELAQKMAALCDIFVHDAFGTAHRAEASTYGIAQYAKIACAGPLLAAEIDAITKALAHPKRPLVAIVAGSKVSTKLTILQGAGPQRRPADRRRRHRQHLHAGRRPEDRQVAGRGRPGGRSARRDRGDEGARRRGADPDRRGHRQDLRRRRTGHRQGRERGG